MFLLRSGLCPFPIFMSQPLGPNKPFHCEGSEVIDESRSISLMYGETYLGKGECVSNLTRNHRSDTVFDCRRGQHRNANARGYERDQRGHLSSRLAHCWNDPRITEDSKEQIIKARSKSAFVQYKVFVCHIAELHFLLLRQPM